MSPELALGFIPLITNRLDPYPVEIIKRVDRPTTKVKEDEVSRVDERESGFNRALRGDMGDYLQRERYRFVAKHPLSGALGQMKLNLVDFVDGEVAPKIAPVPTDRLRSLCRDFPGNFGQRRHVLHGDRVLNPHQIVIR